MGDLHEPLLAAMAQALPFLIHTCSTGLHVRFILEKSSKTKSPRKARQAKWPAKCLTQKSLGVHKILVRKNLVSPPPEKAQNEEKLYKSVENPRN